MSQLSRIARRSDSAIVRARNELVAAVRRASAQGLTQAQIATEIGRSQPEVHRLLHFHGTTPRGRALRGHRKAVCRLIREAGGTNVRVFGSVAREADGDGSDIDLLFTMERPMSLFEIGRLEQRLADLIGVPVDLVPESALRPDLADQVTREAVPV